MLKFFKSKKDRYRQLVKVLNKTGKELTEFQGIPLGGQPFSGFYLLDGRPAFLYKEPAWKIIISYNTSLNNFREVWPCTGEELFIIKDGYIPKEIQDKVLAAFPGALKTFEANLQKELESELEKKYGTRLVL